jgi:hypothetical protein
VAVLFGDGHGVVVCRARLKRIRRTVGGSAPLAGFTAQGMRKVTVYQEFQ